jgi:glycosyltransferase involved in cell wall biosynthesis
VIRVLLVDPSPRGGIAAYSALVTRALSEASACPTVLGSAALEESPAEAPVLRALPADRWGKPRRAGPGFYARRLSTWLRSANAVLREVRRRRPDVIHFQVAINRRFDAALIRRLSRQAPVVWTAHNALPFERTARDAAWFAGIYRSADAVIVHNELVGHQVRELSGVEPVVVAQVVPQKVIDVSREEARRRLGLPESGRVVAALGFIRPYKGYDLLADVWEGLGNDAPLLLVMGELVVDSEQAVLDRLAGSERVDLRPGYVPEEDLQLAASAADALLLPYREASDSGLLHLARALSVPVIASDQPQLASMVEATESGRVVPRDADAWAAAVTGPLPAPPPTPPGPREIGERHVELYRRLLAKRLPSPGPFRLVTYVDADELGGAERALRDLLEALDPAISVTVLGTSERVVGWIANARGGTATCVIPKVRDKRDLRNIANHRQTVAKLRPDVFHASLQNPWACQYGIAAALTTPGTKVIAFENLPTPPTSELQRRLKRLASRRLHAHVAPGLASARELERTIGLRSCSVRTIPYGIRWQDGRPAAREFAGPTVVALGRLTRQKGFDVLLRALARLDDASAVIVGDGPEATALERLRAELGLDGRVRFAGWVDDPAALVRSADALVLPSRYEALPLAILEAMHAGLPVVATDVGSIREEVRAGETGLLVPAEDPVALASAIDDVLDPAIGRAMGARAKDVASQQFTSERMARDFELLYRMLLG